MVLQPPTPSPRPLHGYGNDSELSRIRTGDLLNGPLSLGEAKMLFSLRTLQSLYYIKCKGLSWALRFSTSTNLILAMRAQNCTQNILLKFRMMKK